MEKLPGSVSKYKLRINIVFGIETRTRIKSNLQVNQQRKMLGNINAPSIFYTKISTRLSKFPTLQESQGNKLLK